jgi:hypothetical protein
MTADPPTTITVPSSIARRLMRYRTGGKSYAEVLEEFMDAVPPSQFLDWAVNELKRPAVRFSTARRSLGLR